MRAARIDENQNEVVKKLRGIAGVTVELDHNDFLIGYQGRTYWIEWKSPNAFNKDGSFKKGAIKKSQHKLKAEFTGHYKICWTLEQILDEIGIKR